GPGAVRARRLLLQSGQPLGGEGVDGVADRGGDAAEGAGNGHRRLTVDAWRTASEGRTWRDWPARQAAAGLGHAVPALLGQSPQASTATWGCRSEFSSFAAATALCLSGSRGGARRSDPTLPRRSMQSACRTDWPVGLARRGDCSPRRWVNGFFFFLEK